MLSLIIVLSVAWLPAVSQTTTPPVFWLEDFSLPDSTKSDSGATGWTAAAPYSQAAYGVFGNAFKINNTNNYKGPVVWTSSPIPIAGKTNIQLSVTARSFADVGGWLEYDDSNIYDYELADYIRMYYKVDGGPEILFGDLRANIKLNCGDTTVVSTLAISGSTLQIIVRARATAADEYYYFDNVTVAGETACTADAAAAVSGGATLTCARDSVQLLGGTTVAGAAYKWSGPNGFSSALQNPFIRTPGAYTLLVTAPGGCTATASVVAAQDINSPAGVTTSSSDRLTCITTQVTLRGTSTTTGVNFVWTGPNDFSASSAVTAVAMPGVYKLNVINPTNGCATTVPITVQQNTTPPADVTATHSGPLTCDITEVTLTGSTSSTGVTFEWNGPDGYLSFSAEDVAREPGEYTLIVTNDDNGCTATKTTTVAYSCNNNKTIIKPLNTVNK